MDKKSAFTTDFSITGLSLIEQEKLYNELVRLCKKVEKEDAEISVIIKDPIGGIHKIGENKSISPDGHNCKNCVHIDCRECSHYLRGEYNE